MWGGVLVLGGYGAGEGRGPQETGGLQRILGPVPAPQPQQPNRGIPQHPTNATQSKAVAAIRKASERFG